MSDYVCCLTVARSQLNAAEEQAKLGNLGMALVFVDQAQRALEEMAADLRVKQRLQNIQRAS